MQIKRITWNVVDSNSYLIIEKQDGLKQGLLIDVVDSKKLYYSVRDIDNLKVILTHCHFDHVCGLNKLRKLNPSVSVISTLKCSEYIGNKCRNMSSSANAFLYFYKGGVNSDIDIPPFVCAPADETFDKDITFFWCGHSVELKNVYGHGDDGLIVVVDGKYLFSGDTLMNIPTVTRFPKGSGMRFWEEDVPMLARMTNIEVVYPGHGKPGELKVMLDNNIIAMKNDVVF